MVHTHALSYSPELALARAPARLNTQLRNPRTRTRPLTRTDHP